MTYIDSGTRVMIATAQEKAMLKTLPRLSRLTSLPTTITVIAVALTLAVYHSSAQSSAHPAPFSHALPQMDGNHLRAIVVEVNYGPGEADKPHSHPCVVIGYVAQGSIRFQVRGGPESVYKAGESFYEAPNGVHQGSANASATEPAKLVAYFICDHETPLTVPPIDGKGEDQMKHEGK
jgi:quercetin dioxygenase-like cupin family protein